MENGFCDAEGQIHKAEYADTAFVIQFIFSLKHESGLTMRAEVAL